MTTARLASCSCGQLQVSCSSDPVRISICHCLECQRRTGSVFSTNARFARSAVSVAGASKTYMRTGDSGRELTFHFCPNCGSTVFWELASVPDVIAVAVGAFADSSFPAPRVSVYELRRHDWVPLDAIPGLDHHD
jgi:hypothetical protein